MSTSAQRMKAHRARRKRGTTALTVDVDMVALAEYLALRGLLDHRKIEDHAAVSEALGLWLLIVTSPRAFTETRDYSEAVTASRRILLDRGTSR